MPFRTAWATGPISCRRTIFLLTGLSAWLTPSGGLAASTPSFAKRLSDGPGLQNHPVRVVPSSAVSMPKGWPLDSDGTIKCTTCHTSLPSLDGAGEPMLRDFDPATESPVAFCGKCHVGESQRNVACMHALIGGRAHITVDQDRSVQVTGTLDHESRQCLSCHDGVTAGEHMNGASASGMSFRGGPGRAHPVGVPYNEQRSRKRSVRLRPKSLLPTGVRLPGGAVSCVSCHDLFGKRPSLLAVPIEASRLCLTCHDMD